MQAAPKGPSPFRYCGRAFTEAEVETIRGLSENPRYETRAEIARAVCAALHWVKPDGQPKVVSCHVALQRMEAHGVIWLPRPTRAPVRPRPPRRTAAGEPPARITGSLGDIQDLRLVPVTSPRSRVCGTNSSIATTTSDAPSPPGRSAATWLTTATACSRRWALAPRPGGWPPASATSAGPTRSARPICTRSSRTAGSWCCPGWPSADWLERAGCRPVLLETFVERERFRGTSYAAANWVHVGQTQGRGRNDRQGRGGQPIRDIWLLPLDRRFRTLLTDGRLPALPSAAGRSR